MKIFRTFMLIVLAIMLTACQATKAGSGGTTEDKFSPEFFQQNII